MKLVSSLQALLQRVKILAKFAILPTFLYLCGCEQPQKVQVQPPVEPPAPPPTELSRAIYSAHLQLDPQFVKAVADAAPVRDLFTGLMIYNPQGEVVFGVAKSVSSKDGKIWQIELDENAKWSNGEAVTAYDFSESWRRLASPSNASPLAPYLIYMDIINAKEVITGEFDPEQLGVEAKSATLLEVQLKKTNFQFPKMLAHTALLPTYQGQKPTSEQLISNGKYHIKEQTKISLALESRDPELAFKTVRYQLIGTVQNPDRFDIIENPLESYQRNLVALPRLCTYFYEFNFEDKYLSKKEFRQAIRAMISSSEISRDLGIPNHWALPKTMVTNQERQMLPISVEQLFHKLGVDPAHPIQLTLTYDDEGQHRQIAQRIARTLGQSDLFRVTLQPVDWKLLLTKRDGHNFQFIRSGWCGDYDDPALFLMPFHSQSPDNKSGYHNEMVDRQLEKLQASHDSKERTQIISSIIKQLENDVAILPLFQYQRRIAISPEIRGVELNNTSEVIYSKDLYRQ